MLFTYILQHDQRAIDTSNCVVSYTRRHRHHARVDWLILRHGCGGGRGPAQRGRGRRWTGGEAVSRAGQLRYSTSSRMRMGMVCVVALSLGAPKLCWSFEKRRQRSPRAEARASTQPRKPIHLSRLPLAHYHHNYHEARPLRAETVCDQDDRQNGTKKIKYTFRLQQDDLKWAQEKKTNITTAHTKFNTHESISNPQTASQKASQPAASISQGDDGGRLASPKSPSAR